MPFPLELLIGRERMTRNTPQLPQKGRSASSREWTELPKTRSIRRVPAVVCTVGHIGCHHTELHRCRDEGSVLHRRLGTAPRQRCGGDFQIELKLNTYGYDFRESTHGVADWFDELLSSKRMERALPLRQREEIQAMRSSMQGRHADLVAQRKCCATCTPGCTPFTCRGDVKRRLIRS